MFQEFFEAFEKLKTKDKVVLGVVGAALSALLVAILFMMTNIGSLRIKFPESHAMNTQDFQKKQTAAFTDLNVPIIFPGTSLGCNVGGEVVKASEDGCLFKFSDEAMIATYVVPSDETTVDFVKDNYFSLLSGSSEGKYKHKASKTGYLNADYVEYEGGIMKTDGTDYYVLNYRHPTGEDKDTLISVVTMDPKDMMKGMQLLEKIWHTMGEFEYVEAAKAPAEESEAVEAPDVAGADRVQNPTYSNKHTVLSRAEQYDETMQAREDEIYQMNNRDTPYLEQSFVVPRSMSETSVVFDCTYTDNHKTPAEAYVESPNGEIYYADYLNENRDGRISVRVENPVPGSWTLKVKNTAPLGYYNMNCVEADVYQETITPNSQRDEPMPHPAD